MEKRFTLMKKLGCLDKKHSFGEFKCNLCNQLFTKRLDTASKTCECEMIEKRKWSHLRTIWGAMKGRCLNPRSTSFNRYGARGITICDGWLDFSNFKLWCVKNGYRKDLSIDRINNEKGYGPLNCQWISMKENNRKRKFVKNNILRAQTIRRLYSSGNYRQEDLARMFNIDQTTVSQITTGKTWMK